MSGLRRSLALPFRRPFDETEHLADGDRFRRPRQQVSAFRAAARFHEAALLQAGQNQFQELLRNLLPPRDFGDLDRLARRWAERSKIACSAYSPLTEMFMDGTEYRVSQ